MKTEQKIVVAFGLTTVFTVPVIAQTNELVNQICPFSGSEQQSINTLYLQSLLTYTTRTDTKFNLNKPPQEPHWRSRFPVTFVFLKL